MIFTTFLEEEKIPYRYSFCGSILVPVGAMLFKKA